jgi:hypothetical protein
LRRRIEAREDLVEDRDAHAIGHSTEHVQLIIEKHLQGHLDRHQQMQHFLVLELRNVVF